MRKLSIILSCLLLALSGCRSDFDWKTSRLSDFGQTFVVSYGWPDSRQNWNTAMQYSVTVSIEQAGSWNVKMFTADPVSDTEKSYLLGNYKIVADGSVKDFTVDGPYTLQTLCVGIEDGNYFALKSIEPSETGAVDVSFETSELKRGRIPSVDKMSYFIAYEVVDSAKNYLDYNDVVIEVVHASGEDVADVKLRAVGAKEEMSVVYKYDDKDETLFENVHGAFGAHKTSVYINVENGTHNFRAPIVYKNLRVEEDFSIYNDADRFAVRIKGKKDVHEFSMWPNIQEYLGTPPYAFLVANPKWDWASEGRALEEKMLSFPYWQRSYRLYNTWWDTMWCKDNLVLLDDGSYRPYYDYVDMIYGPQDIRENGRAVPEISYRSLQDYTSCEVGVMISFVLLGRNEGNVKIALERADGGPLEWYPTDDNGVCQAVLEVSGKNKGIDAGEGCYAESCHILLSTATIQKITDYRTSLKVYFDPGETETTINSVWIKER